jgi:hypothetical protein
MIFKNMFHVPHYMKYCKELRKSVCLESTISNCNDIKVKGKAVLMLN